MEQRSQQLEKQGSRQLKSTPEPPQNCPRCESSNTKFCYYNNYSYSQPRYFCRACRRYWTQGGNLRNLPQASSAARRAAKFSKRVPSSTSTSVVPLHHQMSTVAAGLPWCFSGGGVLRQSMGYEGVDPAMVVGIQSLLEQPEIAGVVNSVAGEEGDRMVGSLFGEGGVGRMPSASSGSFI